MKKLILLMLLVSGCSTTALVDKGGQLTLLKKNLKQAEKQRDKQTLYIKQLEVEIAHLEISSIMQEIGKVNPKEFSKQLMSAEQWTNLFFSEREILGQIIHQMPDCRDAAQEVLDQILTLITQLSE